MKSFINRPVSRLLQYQLLMEIVLRETPPDHEDQTAIPQLLEVIKVLYKGTEPGVASAKRKIEVWRFNSDFVFKPGDHVVSFLSFRTTIAA
jgi:RHO1 GDP-GTP exchange protein 1/2